MKKVLPIKAKLQLLPLCFLLQFTLIKMARSKHSLFTIMLSKRVHVCKSQHLANRQFETFAPTRVFNDVIENNDKQFCDFIFY